MDIDPYQVLGVSSDASSIEIKAAYRTLVKKHHPDTGGNEERILAINAAWEVLGDLERRRMFDRNRNSIHSFQNEAQQRETRNACASAAASAAHGQVLEEEDALVVWMQKVYVPIDRLLGEVINPFPAQFRALSADPYDEDLMAVFCSYLEQSQKTIGKS